MKIDGAKMVEEGLLLQTTDPDARRLVYGFESGEYEITKAKKRRSLDANAYAWVLIGKIASAVNMPRVEVYRNAIREIGGVSEIVCVKACAVDRLRKTWERNGLGWQTETMPSKIGGCVNVVLYYGSSSYDSKQMAVFIDQLMEDAKAIGIETLSDRELSILKEEWGA